MIKRNKNYLKQTKPSKVVSKYTPEINQKMMGFGKCISGLQIWPLFWSIDLLNFGGVPRTMKHCSSGTSRLKQIP